MKLPTELYRQYSKAGARTLINQLVKWNSPRVLSTVHVRPVLTKQESRLMDACIVLDLNAYMLTHQH